MGRLLAAHGLWSHEWHTEGGHESLKEALDDNLLMQMAIAQQVEAHIEHACEEEQVCVVLHVGNRAVEVPEHKVLQRYHLLSSDRTLGHLGIL